MWDFAVVGGGIGGLAVAELLQRSGVSVLLIEKNPALCSQASAEQQGWFHTGALYTALPVNRYFRTMVGNLDDLVDYYAGFPNMNLRVDKHIYTTDKDGWFSNRTNFYAYANCKSVSWRWKLPWAMALRRAKKRMSWFENLDVARSLSGQMGLRTKATEYVVHRSPLGVELDDVAYVLKSRDRTMNSAAIAQDLLRSFVANGGLVKTRTTVLSVENGAVVAQESGSKSPARFPARHVVLTAGKDSVAFDRKIKVYISPLLVAYPAFTDMNFVKMSPHPQNTVNHIYHRVNGMDYSLVGNAVYYDARESDPEAMKRVRSAMLALVGKVFGSLEGRQTEVYLGYKTEITSSSALRNYLYHIVDRGPYTLALPGKFSLCFSLAVNVCRHFGIEPVRRVMMKDDPYAGDQIEDPLHYRIAKQLRSRHLTS